MKFEFETAPANARRQPVCDGIDWVRMPLPFALDHVNCWLLGERDEQVLVDTGVDDVTTRAHWQTIFGEAGHIPGQLLITHFHPDHMGLAGWFGVNGCQSLRGSEVESGIAQALWSIDDDDFAQTYELWYRSHGLSGDVLEVVRRNGNTYRRKVHRPPDDEQCQYVKEGEVLSLAGRQYTVMIGHGHSPDMIMLYRRDDHVLIAADQVLPSISPNVSIMPRLEDNNPLTSFLLSLTHLEALPEDTLVLPSHGLPFRGLRERIQVLKQHHTERLEQVLTACQQAVTAHDLFAVLYRRKLDAQQTSFALGEALAHLHYLEQQGKLVRSVKNGVNRFLAN